MSVKISDLIKRLELLKEIHGDLRVCAAEIDGGGWGEITDLNDAVWYRKESPKFWSNQPNIIEECISIDIS